MHTTRTSGRSEASRAYGQVMNAFGQVHSTTTPRFVEFRADVQSTIKRAKAAGMRSPSEFGRALIDAGIYPLENYFGVRVTAADKRAAHD